MPTEITGVVLEALVSTPPAVGLSGVVLEALCGGPSLDPIDSALEALALHFRRLSGLGGALAAYPEHGVELDLRDGPLVTVAYVTHQREDVAPAPVPGDPRKRLWYTADLLITVQIDLWGDYRYRRSVFAPLVETHFQNRMPWQEGLYLVSSAYHGRPLVVLVEDGVNVNEGEAAEHGEWRRRWTATVQTDMVRDIALPLQQTITIRPTSGADVDVTDPDTDLT